MKSLHVLGACSHKFPSNDSTGLSLIRHDKEIIRLLEMKGYKKKREKIRKKHHLLNQNIIKNQSIQVIKIHLIIDIKKDRLVR